MKVLVYLNQKGGVGKTTTASGSAAVFTALGYKVLVIDADSFQASITDWADINRSSYFDVHIQKAAQLTGFISRNQDSYDYILIDCPPRADKDTAQYINVAHAVIIPIQPSPYDVWGCRDVIEMVKARRALTSNVPGMPIDGLPHVGFCLTRANKRLTITKEVTQVLQDTGFPIFDNMTTNYDVYPSSVITGHTIFDAPRPLAAASIQIIGIARETLALVNDCSLDEIPTISHSKVRQEMKALNNE